MDSILVCRTCIGVGMVLGVKTGRRLWVKAAFGGSLSSMPWTTKKGSSDHGDKSRGKLYGLRDWFLCQDGVWD